MYYKCFSTFYRCQLKRDQVLNIEIVHKSQNRKNTAIYSKHGAVFLLPSSVFLRTLLVFYGYLYDLYIAGWTASQRLIEARFFSVSIRILHMGNSVKYGSRRGNFAAGPRRLLRGFASHLIIQILLSQWPCVPPRMQFGPPPAISWLITLSSTHTSRTLSPEPSPGVADNSKTTQ